MLKRVITGLGAFLLLTAPLSSAEAVLLAKIEADVDGSGQKRIVELTGDKKMPGSNYYSNLWIMVKNAEGRVQTGWRADLDGGYYCLLEKMPVNVREGQKFSRVKKKDIKANRQGAASEKNRFNGKENAAAAGKERINSQKDTEKRFEKLLKSLEETGDGTDKKSRNKNSDKPHDQILLLAAKGGKNAAVGCRILDFSDFKRVREVFSGADSLGVAAKAEYKPDNQFTVECGLQKADGLKRTVSFSGSAKNVLRLYNADGSIAKPWLRPLVTEVTSLTVLGGRLFTEQNVLAADGQELLGRLAVRWVRSEDKWIPEEVALKDTLDELLVPDADDSNRAGGAGNWRLYPRRAFIGNKVISRPVAAVEERPELQNKINEKLLEWFAKAPEEDERAFQIKFAGSKLLSLELGRRNKKGEVVRDLYNFNMQSGELLKLENMFNTKNPDFLKVINLVGKPKNGFTAAKPFFWHFTGKHFILQDRLLGEGFQDEDAIHLALVEKNDLLPFLRNKNILE